MVRKLKNYLTIKNNNKKHNFYKDFTYHIYEVINCLQIVAIVKLQSTFLKDSSSISIGDKCFLSIEIDSSPALLTFKGEIRSITNKESDIIIEAVDYSVTHEEYNNTFQDSTLKDILSEFKNTLVSTEELKIPQVIFQGSKCQSFINLMNEYKRVINSSLYFSTFYDSDAKTKIVVRNTPQLPDTEIYPIKSYTKFIQNNLTILPMPHLRIGDQIKLHNKTKTITALALTERVQTLRLKENNA